MKKAVQKYLLILSILLAGSLSLLSATGISLFSLNEKISLNDAGTISIETAFISASDNFDHTLAYIKDISEIAEEEDEILSNKKSQDYPYIQTLANSDFSKMNVLKGLKECHLHSHYTSLNTLYLVFGVFRI